MLAQFVTCLFFVFPLVADAPNAVEADVTKALVATHQYVVDLRIVETPADGRTKLLAEPTLVVNEGRPATMFVGREIEIPGADRDQPQKAGVGTRVRVTVFRDEQARTMLDVEVELSDQVGGLKGDGEFQLQRRAVRTVVAVTPERPCLMTFVGVADRDGQLHVEAAVRPRPLESP